MNWHGGASRPSRGSAPASPRLPVTRARETPSCAEPWSPPWKTPATRSSPTRSSPASGAEPEASGGRVEACLLQRAAQGTVGDRRPIGALDRQLAEGAFPYGPGQRLDGRAKILLLAEREQGASAALDVEDEATVDEDDEGAGLPPGLVRHLTRPVGPRKSRAIRVGRIGRGQDHHIPIPPPTPPRDHVGPRRRLSPASAPRAGPTIGAASAPRSGPAIGAASAPRSSPAIGPAICRPAIAPASGRRRRLGAHPIDRAGKRELRPAQPFHEVATPAAPALLECPQHLINSGKPARQPFGRDTASGHHAVPFEQDFGLRLGALGGIRRWRRQQPPSAAHRRRTA